MRKLYWFALFLAMTNVQAADVVAANSSPTIAAQLYRNGVLPNGGMLQGMREGGASLSGEAAACVNCHRRSGLGTTEGQIVIPPIIGKYLFRPLEKNIHDTSLPHVQNTRIKRSPYTPETLARVIRDGVDSDGRTLNYLMPRFNLDDATMASLTTYLADLTSKPEPGVTEDVLHFATIITPDADPVARDAMLEVMHKFISDKNEFQHGGARPIQSNSRAIKYRIKRRWQLHVWKLSGAPKSWQQQLHDKLIAEPVFAVISGVAGKTWEPVHRFCEQEALPCLFPNVELPVVAEKDFYSVYFSRAGLLEASLIAHHLQENSSTHKPKHIVQIYRKGDVGESLAATLRSAPELAGLKISNRELSAAPNKVDMAKALMQIGADDVLVLWLRPADLAALPPQPVKTTLIYISGTLGTLEQAPLPAAWRTVVKMAYPYDLPDKRLVRMNYPLGWFRVSHIAVVKEQVQSDTYLACGILAETLNNMLDSFVRDYLIERVEVMLSHRLITGYYPRLSLAPGQRFASKGGYIVHFSDAQSKKLIADTDWVIP